ncbi:hypothetical protein BDZ91DRAFT_750002 [Kalaharituber pfeilii]|nr:hypothetical protein BDZ91DRAFT_750002 [Kalaharituber pfeilii]
MIANRSLINNGMGLWEGKLGFGLREVLNRLITSSTYWIVSVKRIWMVVLGGRILSGSSGKLDKRSKLKAWIRKFSVLWKVTAPNDLPKAHHRQLLRH